MRQYQILEGALQSSLQDHFEVLDVLESAACCISCLSLLRADSSPTRRRAFVQLLSLLDI